MPKKLKLEKIITDYQKAREYRSPWNVAAKEDFDFAVGIQWDDVDVQTLKKAGVRALTINKIQPYLFLVSGMQRQNRSDFMAFPEGGEDQISSEIATRLLKNIAKRSNLEYKVSEMFDDTLICGEGYFEPYIDYTYDLLTGEMKFAKLSVFNIYPDPDSKEYDMSDAKYVVKVAPKLTRDQLDQLFPGETNKRKLDLVQDSKYDIDGEIPYKENPTDSPGSYDRPENVHLADKGGKEPTYDLLEYHYKNYVLRYMVVDRTVGTIKEAKDREEAETYHNTMTERDKERAKEQGVPWNDNMVSTVVIERVMPENWICRVVGDRIMDDKRADSYPRWRHYSIIPCYARRISTRVSKREYKTQGMVRSLKDPQRELNKRRTQELRIVNQSSNSGWLSEQGAWVDKRKVKKWGSAAGVLLEYKKSFTKPERLQPPSFPFAHANLAAENTQDMKEISGVNADALAMQTKETTSGRAILLRQKQAVVIIQGIFDNLSQTKNIIGRYLLSQLGEVFTTETALRVLGEQFIKDNFVEQEADEQGNPVVDPGTKEPKLFINQKKVWAMVNKVLNDTAIGKYDVTISESAQIETIRYANYLLLIDLIQKGIPIPPDIIITESTLDNSSKIRIKEAIRQAQAQAQTPAA